MDISQYGLRLLPRYFNKVGLGVLTVSVLFMILSYFEIIPIERTTANTIAKSIFLISLLIFAITKNKVEDELTLMIRLKALASSFIYGVVTVIIDSFLGLFSGGEFLSYKGVNELLISMFLFYFVMVFFYKKYR